MRDLFIIQFDEGEIAVAYKQDVDDMIKESEDHDHDITWKVIAKIKGTNTRMDLTPNHIEWYEKGDKDKTLTDKVILSTIQFILNG